MARGLKTEARRAALLLQCPVPRALCNGIASPKTKERGTCVTDSRTTTSAISLEADRNQGGYVNVYRYGAEGKYDVRVVDQGISPVDWESVIRQMPTTTMLSLELMASQRKLISMGFQQGKRRLVRGSYHSQVLTHQADRDALVAIYRAGGGRNWASSKGWRQGCDAEHKYSCTPDRSMP